MGLSIRAKQHTTEFLNRGGYLLLFAGVAMGLKRMKLISEGPTKLQGLAAIVGVLVSNCFELNKTERTRMIGVCVFIGGMMSKMPWKQNAAISITASIITSYFHKESLQVRASAAADAVSAALAAAVAAGDAADVAAVSAAAPFYSALAADVAAAAAADAAAAAALRPAAGDALRAAHLVVTALRAALLFV